MLSWLMYVVKNILDVSICVYPHMPLIVGFFQCLAPLICTYNAWHNGVLFFIFVCGLLVLPPSTVNDKSLSKEEGCLGDVPEVKVTFHFQRQPRWWCDRFEWYLWEWWKGSCWQGCAPSSPQERFFCSFQSILILVKIKLQV